MDFKPFTTSLMGSLPRSSKLRKAKRALKRGEISSLKFDEIFQKNTAKIIEFQFSLGVEIFTSGKLARDNYVSFVSSNLNGVKEMNMADMMEFRGF